MCCDDGEVCGEEQQPEQLGYYRVIVNCQELQLLSIFSIIIHR